MGKSKFRLLFVLLIVLSLALVACGGGETETPEPEPQATEEPTVETEEPTVETEEPTVETEEPTVETEEPMEATDEPMDDAGDEADVEATDEPMDDEGDDMGDDAGAEATDEPMDDEGDDVGDDAGAEATDEPMDDEGDDMGEGGDMDMGPSVMLAPGEEVKLGFAGAMTGSVAAFGEDIRRGVEMALEDRPTVMIGDEEFEVVIDVQDSLCTLEGGQTVANRFVADEDIVAVIGPMCSDGAIGAMPIFDEAGYTNISASATAAVLTSSGSTSFNRVVTGDTLQGIAIAAYIYNELGFTKLAVIHDGSTYGEGLVEVVKREFEALGGEIVAEDAVTVGDTSFEALLEDIGAAEPEMIFFGGFNQEGALLAEQRANVGLEDVPFMGADGIFGPTFIELAGPSAENVYASRPIPTSGQAVDDFAARYLDKYGEEQLSAFSTNAYDATTILLDAIEAVGYIDDNGDLVVERAALADYVRSASRDGLTGALECDGSGECSTAAIGIYQVQEGEYVQVFGEMEEPMDDMGDEADVEATDEPMDDEGDDMGDDAGAEATDEPMDDAGDAEGDDMGESGDMDMGPSVMLAPGEEVKLGFAGAMTGSVAAFGEDIRRGVEMALEDRPTVMIGDEEFEVVIDVQDSLCTLEGGQTVANRFVADEDVVAVIGPMCSDGAIGAMPIFDEAGYTNISASATAAVLTSSGSTSFNRVVTGDTLQGIAIASYIYNELGFTKLAVIHDGSTYGEGLVEVVKREFEALGGEIVAEDAVTVGDTSFEALLEDIGAAEPEMIFFGGFNQEGALLAEQRANVGLEDVPFMGADGIFGPTFIELAGPSAENVYASRPIPTSSDAVEGFAARYLEKYGEEQLSAFSTNAYDATTILLDAIEAVGYIDDNGDLVVERAALADYVRSASRDGLTGALECDGSGECSTAAIGIYQVQEGEYVQVFGEMEEPMDDMGDEGDDAGDEAEGDDMGDEADAEATDEPMDDAGDAEGDDMGDEAEGEEEADPLDAEATEEADSD